MKKTLISISLIFCIIFLASCGTNNTSYFKEKLTNAPDELLYMPVLLKKSENPDDIKTTISPDIVTYLYTDEAEGKSGYVYKNINLHIRKHSQNVDKMIETVVDSYSIEPNSAVKAVNYEFKNSKYAITYEIRPDLGYTVLNVIFAADENISAYYTMQLNLIPEDITDEILEKICTDTALIKL